MVNKSTLKFWLQGVRIYIAAGIVLFTIEAWWWASASYSGSTLFATRLEELFAWVALGLISTAVSIGPFYSIWPNFPAKQQMYDARRLLGIGGAWFSILHIVIAYDSLFKFANPLTLPANYQRAFALGTVAMLILLAMAFTSFDKAFKRMGKWWFRLHRFVYLAVAVILLHAFMIGAHATRWPALIILTASTVFIFSLHAYLAFIRQKRPRKWQLVSLATMFIFLMLILNFGYSQKLGHSPFTGKHTQVPPHTNRQTQMQNMPGMNNMQGMQGMSQ